MSRFINITRIFVFGYLQYMHTRLAYDDVYILGAETHPEGPKGCPNSGLRRRRPCLAGAAPYPPNQHASTSAARRRPRPARRRAPLIRWISFAARTCSHLSVKQHRLDLPLAAKPLNWLRPGAAAVVDRPRQGEVISESRRNNKLGYSSTL